MEDEFKKIWDKLNDLNERIKSIEDSVKKTPNIVDIGNEYEKLITETGINQTMLNEIVYFEEGDFTILSEFPGKNNKEKQTKATLLILTINDICYGVNRMRTQDIKNKLEYMGIGSLTNLSKNLKTLKSYLIPDGKSSESGYKITLPGKKEGVRILNDLSKK